MPFDGESLKEFAKTDVYKDPMSDRGGIAPVEDSNVQSWQDEEWKNYGAEHYLQLQRNTEQGLFGEGEKTNWDYDCKITFLKYDLSSFKLAEDASNLESAVLSLVFESQEAGDVAENQIQAALADSDWTEGTGRESTNGNYAEEGSLVWGNQPEIFYDPENVEHTTAISEPFDMTDGVQEVKIDVTELVQTLKAGHPDEDIMTLALCETAGSRIRIGSKEGGDDLRAPRLIVNTLGAAAEGISLDRERLELETGDTLTLKATVSPEDAWNQNVIWSSEDPEIADVDEAGTITARKAGSTVITATAADGGFQAFCEVTVKEKEEPDDPDQPLRITVNPEDAEGAAGEIAVFTIKAEGSGLSYQWQYANANSSIWRTSSMSGNDTPEITVPIASYRDGQKYRCVVTDQNGSSVTSESAAVRVMIPEDMPVILSQPEDFTGISGETAVFTVEAEGTGLSYQWQYCNEGSSVWRNSSMAGSTTEAISVEIASYRNGQKYRCVVTGASGHSVTSDAAKIIVGAAEGAPVITGQPESYTGEVGATAVFEVKASGTNLTYQWQYCNAKSNIWRASSMEGSTTSKLSVPVTAGRDGQKYRCVITGGNGRMTISETAVLEISEQKE